MIEGRLVALNDPNVSVSSCEPIIPLLDPAEGLPDGAECLAAPSSDEYATIDGKLLRGFDGWQFQTGVGNAAILERGCDQAAFGFFPDPERQGMMIVVVQHLEGASCE
ncbi:MAG: hypothetical protein AAFX02_05390 [Pseudomonadota bacterium]